MGCIYSGLIRQSDLSSDIFIFIPGGEYQTINGGGEKKNVTLDDQRQTIGVILSGLLGHWRARENKSSVEKEDFIPQFVYVK